MSHIRKPLIGCPYCDYTHTGNVTNVINHVRRRHHGQPETYKDKRKAHGAEFEKWLKKCFPVEEKKDLKFGSESVVSSQMTRGKQKNDDGIDCCKNDSPGDMKQETERGGRSLGKYPSNQGKRKNICQICRKYTSSRNMLRHIFMIHIRKLVIRCLYCQFSVTGDTSRIGKHCKVSHPHKPAGFEDGRKAHSAELKMWLKKCFPLEESSDDEGLDQSDMTQQSFPSPSEHKNRSESLKHVRNQGKKRGLSSSTNSGWRHDNLRTVNQRIRQSDHSSDAAIFDNSSSSCHLDDVVEDTERRNNSSNTGNLCPRETEFHSNIFDSMKGLSGKIVEVPKEETAQSVCEALGRAVYDSEKLKLHVSEVSAKKSEEIIGIQDNSGNKTGIGECLEQGFGMDKGSPVKSATNPPNVPACVKEQATTTSGLNCLPAGFEVALVDVENRMVPQREEVEKKPWCKLCLNWLRSWSEADSHVLSHHVKAFFCEHCDHNNFGDEAQINHHMQIMHPGKSVDLRNQLDRRKSEIESARCLCFGLGKDNSTFSSGHIGERQKAEGLESNLEKNKPPVKAEVASHGLPTINCQLCQMTLLRQSAKVHIVERHLNKAVYSCPYCQLASTSHYQQIRYSGHGNRITVNH